jgi:hypothetical protein
MLLRYCPPSLAADLDKSVGYGCIYKKNRRKGAGFVLGFMIPHSCLDTLSPCPKGFPFFPRDIIFDSDSAATPSLGRRIGPRRRAATMLSRYCNAGLVGVGFGLFCLI